MYLNRMVRASSWQARRRAGEWPNGPLRQSHHDRAGRDIRSGTSCAGPQRHVAIATIRGITPAPPPRGEDGGAPATTRQARGIGSGTSSSATLPPRPEQHGRAGPWSTTSGRRRRQAWGPSVPWPGAGQPRRSTAGAGDWTPVLSANAEWPASVVRARRGIALGRRAHLLKVEAPRVGGSRRPPGRGRPRRRHAPRALTRRRSLVEPLSGRGVEMHARGAAIALASFMAPEQTDRVERQ